MGVFLSISRDIFKNTLLAPILEVHWCNEYFQLILCFNELRAFTGHFRALLVNEKYYLQPEISYRKENNSNRIENQTLWIVYGGNRDSIISDDNY